MFALCDVVRETSFALHCYLKHGHLEKVYENGLANRLRKKGIQVEQQVSLGVRDEDQTLLGAYKCDLLIEGFLLVELKAVRHVADEHVAQLLGYLRACRIQHGLLINFGNPKLYVRSMSYQQTGKYSLLRRLAFLRGHFVFNDALRHSANML